ncbi:MAG: LuxR C-terminal-related transcriptional regulator [Syntrophotalea acetylenica]|nr:LuxR C-terminal-related transcriptional regulator [Syntrophotalea acetylenica]
MSPETVKTHIKNIFKKLDVKSRLEAVIAAKERKLIN